MKQREEELATAHAGALQAQTQLRESIEAISEAEMDRKIRFFGAERSLGGAFYIMASDMHEHLGQAIAYARMNHVVPPWTARGQ